MTYLFGQVIIGYKGTCEAITDHTHLSNYFYCLEISDQSYIDYHKILAFKVHGGTNQCLHRSYTCHSTLWADMGVVIQRYACIRLQRTYIRYTHQGIKSSALIRWIFLTVTQFKTQLFKTSILTGLHHPSTRHSLVVWLPRKFQYNPKRWFSVLLRVKRTSDSSLAPQHCLGSILIVSWSFISSHETSNNRMVHSATFRNVLFRTHLLPCILYGDFREVNFDVCYLHNYLTKCSRTKFFWKPKVWR